jgi:hypothetical protein
VIGRIIRQGGVQEPGNVSEAFGQRPPIFSANENGAEEDASGHAMAELAPDGSV